MFFKGNGTPDCAPDTDRLIVERATTEGDQYSRGMYGFFRRARFQNIIGQCGASIVTFALCWPHMDRAFLVPWFIFHQFTILIMAICFTSGWTTRRLNHLGIPRFATVSMVVTMTVGGSVLLIDLEAARHLPCTLSALIVMYACAAGAMVTLGPIERLARSGLFGLLLPGTLACLIVGHYVIAAGTLFFLAVVAFAGVSEMHTAYQELIALRIDSARAAAKIHDFRPVTIR